MKSKIKKLVTIALATTMLLGATLAVNAAPAGVGQCSNMGCYQTLVKTSTCIGRCSKYCGANAYIYRCPNYMSSSFPIPPMYHVDAEAWCDNGHKN